MELGNGSGLTAAAGGVAGRRTDCSSARVHALTAQATNNNDDKTPT
jgi:hypothetical protein